MAPSKAGKTFFYSMLSYTLRAPLSWKPTHSLASSFSFPSPLPFHSVIPLQNLAPHSPPPSLYPHHHIPLWLLSSNPSPLFLTSPAFLLSQTSTPLYLTRDVCLQGRVKESSAQQLSSRTQVQEKQPTLWNLSWTNRQVFNWSNAISFGRLLSGPILAWMIMHGYLLEALVGLMLAGASDWLDGYIARKQGIDSIIGSYLDPLADKVLVGCIALSMTCSDLLHPALVGLVVARDGTLIVGAFVYRAYSVGWKCNSWMEFFNISNEGGIEKMEPIFISKVNTVLQLALIGMVLLQPALGIPDTYKLIPSLSWLVAFTTCSSWLGYGLKYLQKPSGMV